MREIDIIMTDNEVFAVAYDPVQDSGTIDLQKISTRYFNIKVETQP